MAPIGIFTLMLSEALDENITVTITQLLSPLIVGFAMALIFHLATQSWKKALFDALMLVFVVLVLAREAYPDSPVAQWSWFAVMGPVWVLDLLGPSVLLHYLFRSTHSPGRKVVTSLIILSFLLPAYAFQLLVAHRLDGANRMPWMDIFVPVFLAEAVLFAPFLLLSTWVCTKYACTCLLGDKESNAGFEPI